MIRKLLVPNRGEIAIRIARTCREMGIVSVLAHSETDADSRAASFFDETVLLEGSDSRETYLHVEKIMAAASRSGAEAIHPGYGFLSERPELAEACETGGIIFVGPKSKSIRMMGSKAESRKLMETIGIPVVPGYHGDEQSVDQLIARAKGIGYPVLIKASAGGGGKGMKIARDSGALGEAIESAKREAAKAFGDDRLLIERLIEEPRHVEFQVFGDSKGNLVHLFERDCSLQRRHQKVVEESPAPKFSAELRSRMAESALAAARGVAYENAGTVEFILTPTGDFYFLEMNTRIQVEHPVTEMVLGIDLVRAQIAVASGEPLPWLQADLVQRGHAIEVRVYAEDPENDFLPQTGTIAHYDEPSGPGIRVDSGIAAGHEVNVKYDPMLAKVIAWAETRDAAIDRLSRALSEYRILGLTTNVSFLRRVIDLDSFRAAAVSTHFFSENKEKLEAEVPAEAASIAAVLSTLGRAPRPAATSGESSIPSVWDSLGEWGRG